MSPRRSCGCPLNAPDHAEPHVDPVLYIEHGERSEMNDDPLPHFVPGTGGSERWQSPDAYCLCGHPNYLTCERLEGWGVVDLTLHNVGGAVVSTLPGKDHSS